MRKKLCSILLLSSVLLLNCQQKNQEAAKETPAAKESPKALALPEKPPVAGELVIAAELTEIPGSFPANDLYNYAYVMKYKVIQVVQGAYSGSEILVGHYNPRFGREEITDDQNDKVGGNLKSYRVGDIHYLVLSPLEAAWTGAVEDDFFKDKSPRYWAAWADKVR